ncbi:hypothetical protein BKA63DRAFT_540324 [Paraphoma chrysanthemicola]|nr:hypothetical protein BKA63DRAFT_540324 [Paraphoma chrysanthemicola]
MTSFATAQAVENIIGYKFRSGYDDLIKALTAAGALEEDWDGNRKLAQFGTALTHAADFKKTVTSNEHHATIARRTDICRYITFNEQEGAQSSSVLAKAVNAVIAVVFFDCGQDIGVVLKTMRHLSIFTLGGQSVNPTLLSLDDVSDSLDVGCLARSLFHVNKGSHSSSVGNDSDRIPLTYFSTARHVTTDIQQAADEAGMSEEMADDSQILLQQDPSSDDEETNVAFAADQSPQYNTQTVFSRAGEGEEALRDETIRCARQHQQPTGKRTSIHRIASGRTKKLRECVVNSDIDVLRTYLTEEEKKCQDFGHQNPQDTFLTPLIQKAIRDLGKGKTEVLAKILIHIGSPCLVGGLQDILASHNVLESCMALAPRSTPSRAERVHLIASLGHSMSHCQFIRRHNILQLFKECGRANTSVAEVTSRMMQETFPDVAFNTDEYKTKYRWITDIRRLGQRLHMLEVKFGEGILGLMLDQGLPGTDVGITDKMLMTLADTEYAKFVDILDRSQGDLLRALSDAVAPALRALTLGRVHAHRQFDIENMTVDDIAKYPKGSSAFLEHIKETV